MKEHALFNSNLFQNLLKAIIWFTIWYVLVNVLCKLKKSAYFSVWGSSVKNNSVKRSNSSSFLCDIFLSIYATFLKDLWPSLWHSWLGYYLNAGVPYRCGFDRERNIEIFHLFQSPNGCNDWSWFGSLTEVQNSIWSPSLGGRGPSKYLD